MYYAWYDMNSWNNTLSDQPVAPYVSADRSTIERQVTQAQNAGIDGFELNWWGPGNQTDTNLQTLLSVAGALKFRVTADYDMNSPFIHSSADLASHLTYLKGYFSDPSWFRFNGKPVIVFFGIQHWPIGTWAAIRNQVDPSHQVFWMGEGDNFGYLNVFDGIHPYDITSSPDPASQLASYASQARAYPGKAWMATAMPGYDDTRTGTAKPHVANRENGAYYLRVFKGAVATNPDIISINSFNEWREGSMIEPSRSYGDLYLNLTRQLIDAYRNVASGCG